MQYRYAMLEIEKRPNGETTTSEDIKVSHKTTMHAADREVHDGVLKMFDVELSPVNVDSKFEGFWKGNGKTEHREVTVWLTRLKQMIRIG